MPSYQNKIAVGVDVGGSHVTAAAVELSQSEIIYKSRTRMRVNAMGKTEDILTLWEEAILHASEGIDRAALAGVGMAVPGPFDYANGISRIRGLYKYDALYGMDLRQVLSDRLQIAPEKIIFENDAACFLMGEVLAGAAKGNRRAIGVTLGTGFGSALWLDNKLTEGTFYSTPFRDATAEDYISTRWFVKRYADLSGRSVRDVRDLVNQIRLDRTAQLVFREFGHSLTEFLVPQLIQYRPETLVVGGNISLAWDLFMDELVETVKEKAIPVIIAKSELNENAGLIGAAGLFGRSS